MLPVWLKKPCQDYCVKWSTECPRRKNRVYLRPSHLFSLHQWIRSTRPIEQQHNAHYSWVVLCVCMCVFQAKVDWSFGIGMHWCTWMNVFLSWVIWQRDLIHGKYCDWPAVIYSAKIVIGLALVCGVSYLMWCILCRCCADPEAALQQQHGWTPFPLAISSWICGVAASEQQGDTTVWQKQCARTTG